jgi:hypothetical protein
VIVIDIELHGAVPERVNDVTSPLLLYSILDGLRVTLKVDIVPPCSQRQLQSVAKCVSNAQGKPAASILGIGSLGLGQLHLEGLSRAYRGFCSKIRAS